MFNRILMWAALMSLGSAMVASAADEKELSVAKARQQRMKDCGAEWQKAKAEGRTAGKTYEQFSTECVKK